MSTVVFISLTCFCLWKTKTKKSVWLCSLLYLPSMSLFFSQYSYISHSVVVLLLLVSTRSSSSYMCWCVYQRALQPACLWLLHYEPFCHIKVYPFQNDICLANEKAVDIIRHCSIQLLLSVNVSSPMLHHLCSTLKYLPKRLPKYLLQNAAIWPSR